MEILLLGLYQLHLQKHLMKKVKPNSKILFLAFGGLTGAAAVIDWGGRSHAENL